jgi:hypothetical protein
MVYIEINHHHKRATIGHCGSTRDHKCSLRYLTGTSSMMGATSSSHYWTIAATINSMTTTDITYTINSISSQGHYPPGYFDSEGYTADFSIDVTPGTYVISTLPDNITIFPGLPLPQFTTTFKSYPGYTTTLTPGDYDVQINNTPNPPIIPSSLNLTLPSIGITSPKITLTIEE